MNFHLTDEQSALQGVLGRFCRDRFPMTEVRRWGEPGGVDRDRWSQLAALGTFDLADPLGGSGSLSDAVVAFEELGRHLVPGPLVGAAVLAGLIDGVSSGASFPVLLDTAVSPLVAAHLDDADVVVVLDDHGVRRVAVADVTARSLPDPLDPTTVASLVEHVPGGQLLGGTEDGARLRHAVGLLTAALLVGISTASTERAVTHALDRQQFGRPIGSFQAVKHLLADAYTRSELARAALYAAAVTADDPAAGDAIRAAAGARHLAAEAGVSNAKTALQVYGGMGFTWEIDAHLYVKRAWALRASLGQDHLALDQLAGRLRQSA